MKNLESKKKFLQLQGGHAPSLCNWYTDDIYMTWTHSTGDLIIVYLHMSKSHHYVKFEMEFFRKEFQYLYIISYFNNLSILKATLYKTPTKIYSLLHVQYFHLFNCKDGIVYSQAQAKCFSMS